jgi:hypothetical protein
MSVPETIPGGWYKVRVLVTDEVYSDVAIDPDQLVKDRLLVKLRNDGLVPIGELKTSWTQITDENIGRVLMPDEFMGYRARPGDWVAWAKVFATGPPETLVRLMEEDS